MTRKQEKAPQADTMNQENQCGVPLPPRINLAQALTVTTWALKPSFLRLSKCQSSVVAQYH